MTDVKLLALVALSYLLRDSQSKVISTIRGAKNFKLIRQIYTYQTTHRCLLLELNLIYCDLLIPLVIENVIRFRRKTSTKIFLRIHNLLTRYALELIGEQSTSQPVLWQLKHRLILDITEISCFFEFSIVILVNKIYYCTIMLIK